MRTVIVLICLIASSPAVFASGHDYTPPSKPAKDVSKASATADIYKKGQDAVALGNFKEAEQFFSEALKAEPRNPDILNMLAYTQRQEGKFDQSFANYQKAIALRPRFPQAREYLGEAHIQAALKEIETLKSYGPEGKEDLDKLTSAMKEAAAGLR